MKSVAHGGGIYRFAEEIGCSIDEVIDLSSNINFVRPRLEADPCGTDLAPYPDYQALAESLAAHYGVDVHQMELFGGATAAIYALFRFLKPGRVTLYAPLYGEYRRCAELFGDAVELVNRFEGIDREPKAGSLVVFVNPATPEGSYYDPAPLMARWMEQGCTVLVDESFLDFCGGESVVEYLQSYEHLYILKSLTKFYAAAGVRVGALLSGGENIGKLRAGEPPWKLSAFDSAYMLAALKDKGFAERSRVANEANRAYLMEFLSRHPVVEKVYPSCANFVTVRLRGIGAAALQERLIPYRIMVRNCSDFDFLDGRYVRIAVKERQALQRFEEALWTI